MTSLELAHACAIAAADCKASDIQIYDLRGSSTITDYTIVCNATSVPHLRAIIRDIDKDIYEKYEIDSVYCERTPQAQWCVLDYIDVMVHIFCGETREFYALEKLWKEENLVELPEGCHAPFGSES